jgi:hypothetical protein
MTVVFDRDKGYLKRREKMDVAIKKLVFLLKDKPWFDCVVPIYGYIPSEAEFRVTITKNIADEDPPWFISEIPTTWDGYRVSIRVPPIHWGKNK